MNKDSLMLAATIDDVTQLNAKYPLLASPKLDGIRAVVKNGVLYSRNMKPIPNKFVQASMPLARMNGWDGELIVGKPEAKDCFRATTSGIMSEDGVPNFTFYVFDHIPCGAVTFYDRYRGLKQNVTNLAMRFIKIVPQVQIVDSFELYAYEATMLEKGFEGVMLRTLKGTYKHGRSTMKEGALMKLKKFADSEATVLDFVEQMENTNTAQKDALGRTKRTSHKAGKIGKRTLGALQVQDVYSKVKFDIGTGFTDEVRQQIWDERNGYNTMQGKIIKYTFFPSGSKDKPRFPVYAGIRKD